jgi:hypothetical protein
MSLSLDLLWGATLELVNFDIASQLLTINCRVEDDGRVTHHELEFRGISELRFFSSITGPWNYVELKEIHVTKAAAGNIQAEMILWSENAEPECRPRHHRGLFHPITLVSAGGRCR